jgi:hypothetical protein
MLVGPALHLGGAAAGHVAGRTLTARRDAEVHKENAIVDPATEGVQQAAYVNIEPPGDQSPITVLQRPPKP